MKKVQTLTCVIFLAVLISSCSKEDEGTVRESADMAILSFGTLLNNMVSNKAELKQAITELPDCSSEAPAFVEVVLSQEGTPVVGTFSDPLRVELSPNPSDYDGDGVNEYFTQESANLQLVPGIYSLEYFTVLDENGTIIWVSPIDTGEPNNFSAFVETPLPFNIDLKAGVKKYVDVDVLCFNDREVNEYGYLFYDFTTSEVYTFCFFANYCNEVGRHYPAAYSVNIWLGTDNTGPVLYSGARNEIGHAEGEEATAQPLCLVLPNPDDVEDAQDYMYYEVTLLDWEGVYGDVAQTVISGTLSRDDIVANFAENNMVEYEHLRFGCEAFTAPN